MTTKQTRALIRTELSTDLEQFKMKRQRLECVGKNPSWYKKPAMPKPVEYDFSQKLPALFTKQSDPWLENTLGQRRAKLPDTTNTAEYVRQFESMLRLSPTIGA